MKRKTPKRKACPPAAKQRWRWLSPAGITLTDELQSRSSIDQKVVDEYAAAIEGGADFPAVVAFFDGEKYWLADGYHRHAASVQAKKTKIKVAVRHGTKRDALLWSVGANAQHGLRRTNEDKRKSVVTLLNDAVWKRWVNTEIAKQCAVSDHFVGEIRNQMTPIKSEEEKRDCVRDGKVIQMNTGRIGKRESRIDVEAKDAPAGPLPPPQKPTVVAVEVEKGNKCPTVINASDIELAPPADFPLEKTTVSVEAGDCEQRVSATPENADDKSIEPSAVEALMAFCLKKATDTTELQRFTGDFGANFVIWAATQADATAKLKDYYATLRHQAERDGVELQRDKCFLNTADGKRMPVGKDEFNDVDV